MADQIWTNEGLLNELKSMVAGLTSGAGTFLVDVLINPPGPFDNLNTFVGSTFGVLGGSFSAVSGNASGNNKIAEADIVPVGILGNVGLGQALPVTFTNITGAPITVQGFVMYDPTPSYPSGAPLLMNISALDAGPVSVPAGGTITIPVILGDSSQLLS